MNSDLFQRKGEEPLDRISMRMPARLKTALQAEANRRGMSLTDVIIERLVPVTVDKGKVVDDVFN